jgi:mRNA-degrading endonuclease RelE of RelBE toxin-antitoxin system
VAAVSICNCIYTIYTLRFSVGVERELRALRAYDQTSILDGIEEQLIHRPDVVSRRRKVLEDFTALEEWAAAPPIWQVRIGEFRVFYDVDREKRVVWVRAVRRKPAH